MPMQVNALYKMGPVLSASFLHGEKKELLIFVRHFVGQQTSEIIVQSSGVYGHFTNISSSGDFISATWKQRKMVP